MARVEHSEPLRSDVSGTPYAPGTRVILCGSHAKSGREGVIVGYSGSCAFTGRTVRLDDGHFVGAGEYQMVPAAAKEGTLIYEPDEMGVWSDEDTIVWLPRSLYPRRIDAIRWAMLEWDVGLPDVRCLSRWMRFAPEPISTGEIEELWSECGREAPGAFRVWRLEGA